VLSTTLLYYFIKTNSSYGEQDGRLVGFLCRRNYRYLIPLDKGHEGLNPVALESLFILLGNRPSNGLKSILFVCQFSTHDSLG